MGDDGQTDWDRLALTQRYNRFRALSDTMNIFNKIFAIVTLIIAFVTGLIAILFPQTALAAVNGLAADPAGNLFLVESTRVTRVDTNGEIQVIWGFPWKAA